MTLSKGSFLNPWLLAIKISKNDILKNFFYFNKDNGADKNIFFNDDFMYSNSDELLKLQQKQNINLYIELKDKRFYTKEIKTPQEGDDFELKTIYKCYATLELVVFAYTPTARLNKEQYIANIEGTNIKTRMDYFEYVCRMLELTFNISGSNCYTGDRGGKSIMERKYETTIYFDDVIEEKDLEDVEFYLDKIENIKSK